jgi:vancomycin permeability regulator SanA
MKNIKAKNVLKKIFIIAAVLAIVACILAFSIDFYVRNTTEDQIVKSPEGEYDCILVLGAGVRGDRPSPILQDRLDYAIDLYKNNKAPKLLMSGDHGRVEYDEVNIMKDYAIEKGVPSEDIFMDHAGFSTYESIYRARYVFEADSVIIVTQEYHLYRALYVANSLGVNAVGYASNPREYAGKAYRDLREVIARDKDFIYCIFKPEPKYLGPSISVSGNGDVTNDK